MALAGNKHTVARADDIRRIKDAMTGLQAAVAIFGEALEDVGVNWPEVRALLGGWVVLPPGYHLASDRLAEAYDRCMQSGAGEPSDADNQDRMDLADAWVLWKKEQRG